jgi:hypothetical protein
LLDMLSRLVLRGVGLAIALSGRGGGWPGEAGGELAMAQDKRGHGGVASKMARMRAVVDEKVEVSGRGHQLYRVPSHQIPIRRKPDSHLYTKCKVRSVELRIGR